MVIKNKRLATILVVVGAIVGAASAVMTMSTIEFKVAAGFTGALCGTAIGFLFYLLYQTASE